MQQALQIQCLSLEYRRKFLPHDNKLDGSNQHGACRRGRRLPHRIADISSSPSDLHYSSMTTAVTAKLASKDVSPLTRVPSNTSFIKDSSEIGRVA